MKCIPQQEIHQLLAALPGIMGLWIEDLESGERFSLNAERVFPAASVIKLPLLALLLCDVEQGRADWTAPRVIAPHNRVGGTGILCELDADYQPSLETLAKLMIVLSDNTATNEIIDLLGLERVNAFCAEQGWGETHLGRKMLDFEAIRQGRNNYTSARDAAALLLAAARGELVCATASRTLISMMEKQQCRQKLPALLPAVPCWAPEDDRKNLKPGTVLVANKTGDLTGVQHDVGIFALPGGGRYVIAALSAELEQDAAGIDTIARLSLLVYRALAQA